MENEIKKCSAVEVPKLKAGINCEGCDMLQQRKARVGSRQVRYVAIAKSARGKFIWVRKMNFERIGGALEKDQVLKVLRNIKRRKSLMSVTQRIT